MKLTDIRDALLKVGVPVYHYESHKEENKYIVWAESGQGSKDYGDDISLHQTLTGTVDYYTKEEYDLNFEKVQTELNKIGILWNLNSIQYEDDTKYIHYEWTFEVVGEWHG